MSPQEIFDIAVARLRDGTGRSVSRGGNCRYRGPKGLKCVVGIFIPDELYDERIENNSVSDAAVKACLPADVAQHSSLLNDLQKMHDLGTFWSYRQVNTRGEGHLRCIASYHDLTYTPPSQED